MNNPQCIPMPDADRVIVPMANFCYNDPLMIRNILVIGMGGFLGAVSRYGVAVWIGQRWGRSFPLGTFVINVSGSFLIGLLMPLLTERFIVNPQWRLLLVVGFLGAYTTFSTFEYETGALLKDGQWLYAGLNVMGSVVAGFIALKIGEIIAKSI
jgi:fluoride exporter